MLQSSGEQIYIFTFMLIYNEVENFKPKNILQHFSKCYVIIHVGEFQQNCDENIKSQIFQQFSSLSHFIATMMISHNLKCTCVCGRSFQEAFLID